MEKEGQMMGKASDWQTRVLRFSLMSLCALYRQECFKSGLPLTQLLVYDII
jgi:hypothetical protein